MAPNLKTKIVGIRPGEKIHELMCPNEYHHLTLNLRNTINNSLPTIDSKNKNFLVDNSGEIGKRVSSEFEYSSGTNNHFLSLDQIKKINDSI